MLKFIHQLGRAEILMKGGNDYEKNVRMLTG